MSIKLMKQEIIIDEIDCYISREIKLVNNIF